MQISNTYQTHISPSLLLRDCAALGCSFLFKLKYVFYLLSICLISYNTLFQLFLVRTTCSVSVLLPRPNFFQMSFIYRWALNISWSSLFVDEILAYEIWKWLHFVFIHILHSNHFFLKQSSYFPSFYYIDRFPVRVLSIVLHSCYVEHPWVSAALSLDEICLWQRLVAINSNEDRLWCWQEDSCRW